MHANETGEGYSISFPITGQNSDLCIMQKNDPGTPRSRETQQKQSDDAKKEIERKLGRKLTPREERKFHDHISGQGHGYHELVEEGYRLFGGT